LIHEESTIKGLIGVLKSMHTPKDDILCMDLYYKTEKTKRKKTIGVNRKA